MIEVAVFNDLLFASFLLAVGVFISLFFVSAPYGRHIRRGWGPVIPNYLGWMIMEAPASLLFALYFLIGTNPKSLMLFIFFGMWEFHYVHRAFIYPFTISDGSKKMPVAVTLMAILFNVQNTYLNGRYLFTFSDGYPDSWIIAPRFIVGLALFVGGYITNRWADTILRTLRKPGEKNYKIPHGGLFEWISCPNYFGEILEWFGWALATWSLAGLTFAVWTVANLAPRARSHHRWYREHFPEYPQGRKALIPGIW